MRRAVAPLIAGCIALSACGATSNPSTTSAPAPAQPSGRAIGGTQGPEQQAVATATRFTRGLLAYQSGQGTADAVPDTTSSVRGLIAKSRVPPAQRARPKEIASVNVFALNGDRAQVQVTVRNLDEDLTYPLNLELVARGDRWTVQGLADSD